MRMEWKTLLNEKRPRDSRGEEEHRSQFDRDFDRCIFSTPVKRLQDKAQVFPLEPHDAVRTRLTHSLEVSSVARGLGQAVGGKLLKSGEIAAEMARHIEAIAATCGLVHDLGNPPFGHSGEDAIRSWFDSRSSKICFRERLDNRDQLVQDFLKFEGNAQTLRLVTKLQILADFHGLNLTYGTLSASSKYTASSHEARDSHADHAKHKPGFFTSEEQLVEQIRQVTGTGNARNPITFLVEAADDIVYSVADIEDGIKKGILSWKKLHELMTEAGGDVEPQVKEVLKIKAKILGAGADGKEPSGLPDDTHGTAFRTAAVGVLVRGALAAWDQHYEEIMAGTYPGELVMSSGAKPLLDLFKDIGRKRIYNTSANLKLELMGRRIIHDLLDLFWEGVEVLPEEPGPLKTKKFSGKLCALLSQNYREVFWHFLKQQPTLPKAYHRFQLLTDYVCGMTDTFAKRLHAELTNG